MKYLGYYLIGLSLFVSWYLLCSYYFVLRNNKQNWGYAIATGILFPIFITGCILVNI